MPSSRPPARLERIASPRSSKKWRSPGGPARSTPPATSSTAHASKPGQWCATSAPCRKGETLVPENLMRGSYDIGLVALSVVIAILASGAALDLANRVTAATGRARTLWLAGGAVAMGSGVWSMHYVGMLAFRLPVPVLYDVPTVLASWLAAVPAPAGGPPVLGGPKPGPGRGVVGGGVMWPG